MLVDKKMPSLKDILEAAKRDIEALPSWVLPLLDCCEQKDERIAELEAVAKKCKCSHCKQAADLCATVRKLERELAEEQARLLNVAKGCHDYGGGYWEKLEAEIYHHGIQTVINALEAAVKHPNSTQVRVLENMGRKAASDAAGEGN